VAKEALLVGARPIARHVLATKTVQKSITKPKTYDQSASMAAAEAFTDLQSMPLTGLIEASVDDRKARRDELLQLLE
jgi:hypothetical protein